MIIFRVINILLNFPAPCLPFVLSTLMNSAITLDIFPKKLKIFKIIPLFKKGNKLNINKLSPYIYINMFQENF